MNLESMVQKGINSIKSKKSFIFTSSLLALGSLGDTLSTHYILSTGGQEFNFVISPIIDNFGITYLYLIKGAYAAAAISIAAKVPKIKYINSIVGSFHLWLTAQNTYQIITYDPTF